MNVNNDPRLRRLGLLYSAGAIHEILTAIEGRMCASILRSRHWQKFDLLVTALIDGEERQMSEKEMWDVFVQKSLEIAAPTQRTPSEIISGILYDSVPYCRLGFIQYLFETHPCVDINMSTEIGMVSTVLTRIVGAGRVDLMAYLIAHFHFVYNGHLEAVKSLFCVQSNLMVEAIVADQLNMLRYLRDVLFYDDHNMTHHALRVCFFRRSFRILRYFVEDVGISLAEYFGNVVDNVVDRRVLWGLLSNPPDPEFLEYALTHGMPTTGLLMQWCAYTGDLEEKKSTIRVLMRFVRVDSFTLEDRRHCVVKACFGNESPEVLRLLHSFGLDVYCEEHYGMYSAIAATRAAMVSFFMCEVYIARTEFVEFAITRLFRIDFTKAQEYLPVPDIRHYIYLSDHPEDEDHVTRACAVIAVFIQAGASKEHIQEYAKTCADMLLESIREWEDEYGDLADEEEDNNSYALSVGNSMLALEKLLHPASDATDSLVTEFATMDVSG
jgi:hypothetical protein